MEEGRGKKIFGFFNLKDLTQVTALTTFEKLSKLIISAFSLYLFSG
jgi:hypothetical protein